jgi:uncharacterized protein with GYD domain
MPTYISLLKFTTKGIENIKDGPTRLDAARKLFRELGGDVKAFYLTLGQYDAVAIVEAPDARSVVKGALAAGAKGTARTETLAAFPEEDYRRIVEELR